MRLALYVALFNDSKLVPDEKLRLLMPQNLKSNDNNQINYL